MSVVPGKSGQKYILSTHEKTQRILILLMTNFGKTVVELWDTFAFPKGYKEPSVK